MRSVTITQECLSNPNAVQRVGAAIVYHVAAGQTFSLDFIKFRVSDIPKHFLAAIFGPTIEKHGALSIANTLQTVTVNGAVDPRLTAEIAAYLDRAPSPVVRTMPHILQFALSTACLQTFTDCLTETGGDANVLFENMLKAYCMERRAQQRGEKD